MKPDAPMLHATVHRRRRAQADEGLQHRQASRVRPWRRRGGLQARPTSSSSATSRPSRRTRAISSRMPASPASAPTAQASSGSAPRATSCYRNHCAMLLGMDVSKLRVTPSEIGGGFGGKTHVCARAGGARAVAQGRPSGEDGDDARGGVPRLGTDQRHLDRRQDRRQEGRHHHRGARRNSAMPGGAFSASSASWARMTSFACYDLENVKPSATTCWSTARSRRPIARPARRWRPSRSRACSTNSPRRSAWTRSSCA